MYANFFLAKASCTFLVLWDTVELVVDTGGVFPLLEKQ